jgi:hypothetical protein
MSSHSIFQSQFVSSIELKAHRMFLVNFLNLWYVDLRFLLVCYLTFPKNQELAISNQ